MKREYRPKISCGEVSLFLLAFFVTTVLLSVVVFSTLEDRRKVFGGSFSEFEDEYNLKSMESTTVEEFEPIPVDWIKLSLRDVDTDEWKEYTNNWYGFNIKYPQDWKALTSRKPVAGDAWEYRYEFRMDQSENEYSGFDLVVYNATKIENVFATEEFPLLKKEQSQEGNDCESKKKDLIDSNMYSMEKVQSLLSDKCYEPVIFFSKSREKQLVSDKNYIYNVVATSNEENSEIEVDPTKEIGEKFPEFFVVALSLNLVDMKRLPPKPVITAPKPVSYKIDSLGRMVCKKDNDKPGKSKKDKDYHLDMECCLDPDEDPNPWCYYDPVKYGEYL